MSIGGHMSERARQAMAENAGPRPALSPQKSTGHANDGVAQVLTATEVLAEIEKFPDSTFVLARLDAVKMVRGASGETVSGFCRVMVNGQAGALTIYAPKAEEQAMAMPKEPKEIKTLRKLATDKRFEMDKLYPLVGRIVVPAVAEVKDEHGNIVTPAQPETFRTGTLEGKALADQLMRRVPFEVAAAEYERQAEEKAAEYAAQVKAAKGTWEGRTALDVLIWRETLGAAQGQTANAEPEREARAAAEDSAS